MDVGRSITANDRRSLELQRNRGIAAVACGEARDSALDDDAVCVAFGGMPSTTRAKREPNAIDGALEVHLRRRDDPPHVVGPIRDRRVVLRG